MPNLILQANTNTPYLVGNGNDRNWEGTRDGAAFTATWAFKQALMGRAFVVNAGAVTTPLTFLITAANRPDFVLRVPSGTTVVPIKVQTTLETAAGTATEVDIRIAQNDIGNGTSTGAGATLIGPVNLRTDVPYTSLCTPRVLYTADATTETNPVSVHRITYPQAATNGLKDYTDYWRPLADDVPPFLIGPASLEVFIAATTTQATGFIQCMFVELPSAWVTG